VLKRCTSKGYPGFESLPHRFSLSAFALDASRLRKCDNRFLNVIVANDNERKRTKMAVFLTTFDDILRLSGTALSESSAPLTPLDDRRRLLTGRRFSEKLADRRLDELFDGAAARFAHYRERRESRVVARYVDELGLHSDCIQEYIRNFLPFTLMSASVTLFGAE
jgi:hypothetical protein